MPDRDEALDRLHERLGLRRLSTVWAKLEIVLGLAAVAAALFHVTTAAAHPRPPVRWLLDFAAYPALFVAGGYLVLAGHRSHLYRSNNRLAAYLADEIRKFQNEKD